MNWRKVLLAVGFAGSFAIGGIAGLVQQYGAGATTTVSLEVNPGASTTLNCGWHGRCDYPNETAGPGIDWAKTADESIYWRSFGYVSPSAYFAQAYIVDDSSGSCYQVRVDISSPANVTYRGSQYYEHSRTDVANTSFNIWGSSPSGGSTTHYVAYTIAPDKTGCPWTGEHLHQEGYWESTAVSSSSNNTGLYPDWHTQTGTYSVTSQGYWQNKANWSY